MPLEQLHAFTDAVLAMKAGPTTEPAALAFAFERLCGRLRQRLEPLVGVNGVRALFGRALHLSKTDFPWLTRTELAPSPGCALHRVPEATAGVDILVVRQGLSAILGHDLSLLFTFIGDDLGLPLIYLAWPDARRFAELLRRDRT